MQQYVGLLGILALTAIALAMSTDRRRVPWRLVAGGIVLQAAIAFVFLRVPGVVDAFNFITELFVRIIGFAGDGSAFLFGRQLTDPTGPWGFVFAFKVLPTIIFFSALMAILYHVGVMQRVVAALAWMLRKTLRMTGAEALTTAANVFLGQTEAPLCIRPYIATMTQAQLMLLMTGGFATIAGSVLGAYATMLGHEDPARTAEFVKHLIVASVMSAPAAFVFARIMVPETQDVPDESLNPVQPCERAANLLDAAAIGTTDGVKLAINVGAMLIAFVALLALINWPLEALGRIGPIDDWLASAGVDELSLQVVLGWLFAPLAWTLGIPWAECNDFGSLLGTKLVATEFTAYIDLANDTASAHPQLSPRSAILATYALCGFANFPSIGIQIGGLATLAPSRRADFARLGTRAMFAGALATCQTAAIAGLIVPM